MLSPRSAPTPESGTVCGLPVALSVMLNSPARFPATVGMNVTEIWQEPPTGSAAPQLLVSEKSPEYEICKILTSGVASIAQRQHLRRRNRAHDLTWECQARRCQAHCGKCAGTGERHCLRTAGCVVGDVKRSASHTRGSRSKNNANCCNYHLHPHYFRRYWTQ